MIFKQDTRRRRARELRKQVQKTENMLHMCFYGAAVTLIGGIILGACAVTMMR